MLAAEDDGHVYFVETRGRGVFLRATPIDVSERLRELLFERTRAAVLTSATLAVDGRFDYVKDRLGLERLGGAACCPRRSTSRSRPILYVPRRMPEPASPAFVDAAAEEVVKLLVETRGRAFVLFTSYANMNAVAERIAGRVEFPLLIQGEAPKAALLETFRTTPGAVLLATASFWQGVDVVGEQLSCVIIDKLPFASPGDPVVAARIERLRNRGRQSVRRVPGAGGRAHAQAGARPAHPLRLRPRDPGRARQPDRARRPTAGASSTACPPPASSTTWTRCAASCPEAHSSGDSRAAPRASPRRVRTAAITTSAPPTRKRRSGNSRHIHQSKSPAKMGPTKMKGPTRAAGASE